MENNLISATDLLNLLPESFVKLTDSERELSLTIYRKLAMCQPVSKEELESETSLSISEVNDILDKWPGVFYDDDKIIGYWGLAINKMAHKIKLEDYDLYGWCAWDTLFLPQLLDKPATILSNDPVSKEKIDIHIDRNGNLIDESSEIMVSMLLPDEEQIMENIVTSFCHYIYFFENEINGNKWIKENEGTFLISLQQAIELSKTKNKLQYGSKL